MAPDDMIDERENERRANYSLCSIKSIIEGGVRGEKGKSGSRFGDRTSGGWRAESGSFRKFGGRRMAIANGSIDGKDILTPALVPSPPPNQRYFHFPLRAAVTRLEIRAEYNYFSPEK